MAFSFGDDYPWDPDLFLDTQHLCPLRQLLTPKRHWHRPQHKWQRHSSHSSLLQAPVSWDLHQLHFLYGAFPVVQACHGYQPNPNLIGTSAPDPCAGLCALLVGAKFFRIHVPHRHQYPPGNRPLHDAEQPSLFTGPISTNTTPDTDRSSGT